MRKALPYPIYKIGVELEGGFLSSRPMQRGLYHDDSSVEISSYDVQQQAGNYPLHGYGGPEYDPRYDCPNWPDSNDDDFDCTCECCDSLDRPISQSNGYIVTGEYVSRPLKTWDEFIKFIDNCHPDVVNDSCGNHIHASTRNLVYMSMLLENADQIYERMVLSLGKWGSRVLKDESYEWLNCRLKGNNTFCQRGSNKQIITKDNNEYGERYKALNFRSLTQHGTLECRILPAFKKAQHTKEAVHIIMSVYNKVLQDASKAPKTLIQLSIPVPTIDAGGRVELPSEKRELLPLTLVDHMNYYNQSGLLTSRINEQMYPDDRDTDRSVIGMRALNEGALLKKVARAATLTGKKRKKGKKKRKRKTTSAFEPPTFRPVDIDSWITVTGPTGIPTARRR